MPITNDEKLQQIIAATPDMDISTKAIDISLFIRHIMQIGGEAVKDYMNDRDFSPKVTQNFTSDFLRDFFKALSQKKKLTAQEVCAVCDNTNAQKELHLNAGEMNDVKALLLEKVVGPVNTMLADNQFAVIKGWKKG